MKKFCLIDYKHAKIEEKMNRLYEVAAKISLKYGAMGDNCNRYNFDYIREFWNYKEKYPSFEYLRRNIRVKTIKWFLYNKINYTHEIWNADFLNGLTTHGIIKWNRNRFPSFEWYRNKTIYDLLKNCPFGGEFSVIPKYGKYKWLRVPALYLKNSDTTISFMAGVMAGMRLIDKNNWHYAMASSKMTVLPYLMKWGIPIEYMGSYNTCWISPIWPALFIDYMPQECRNGWINIKKSFNANLYAAILWKTYANDNFPVGGIPYLQSRRTIYYNYRCDEGTTKKLEMLRVEKGLTGLDNRIREVIKLWQAKNEKKDFNEKKDEHNA